MLTERFRSWLLGAGLVPPERITVIPCCTPMPPGDGASRTPAPERLEIVYAGSVTGLYLLEEMGQFVLALQTLRPGAFLRVLTWAPAIDVFERLRQTGLSPDHFWVGAAAPEDVKTYLRGAVGGISFRKGTFSQIAASPTKVAEYLAAGLPVVTNVGIGDSGLNSRGGWGRCGGAGLPLGDPAGCRATARRPDAGARSGGPAVGRAPAGAMISLGSGECGIEPSMHGLEDIATDAPPTLRAESVRASGADGPSALRSIHA